MMRGVTRLGSVLACAAGLVACSESTGGEFPILAHGVIEGRVVGMHGQALNAVVVMPVFPAALREQWGFGTPSDETDSDGEFSLPIEIQDGPPEATEFPDVVHIYVAGLAEPPEYPAPLGQENTVDSVAVTVQLKPGDEPPPVVKTTLQLPISE